MQHQWLASLALDALTTRNSGKVHESQPHLINPLPELVNKDFSSKRRDQTPALILFGGYN